MERLKEKGGGCADDDDEQLREGKCHDCSKEKESSALSESSRPDSPPPCHALEGLPTDTTSLQEQQTYPLLVQETEKYKLLYEEYKLLYEEAEVKNRHLMKEIARYGHHIGKQDNELLRLQHHLQQLESHCSEENEKLKVSEEKCRDLSLKIEKAEHLHSQKSLADSGSYQDSTATPPLLQLASDSVKDAITVCASELFSRIKKSSLPINLARMNLDSKETGQITKFALQSFLCHILFIGFEDPFFFASNGLPPFEKPAKRKTRFLQVYRRCRDLDVRQMLDEETDFTLFFGVKEFDLCMCLKEQLLMTDDVQKKEDFITSELRSRDSNYYSKLLRLVKAVWVLHKLAFSFEPSAEIFRVRQDSVLDEEFMEDVAGDDDEDDDEDEEMAESSKRGKQVKFMCVPGFTVRHTIIKSRVFSLKKDTSPMTVDSFVSES